MPLPVNPVGNLAGINARLVEANRNLGQNLTRLASGLRIIGAGDDAAGLAMGLRLIAQIQSRGQAVGNIGMGSALLRTAEGGLSQISDLLFRGRELAVQGGNGLLSAQQRNGLNTEFNQVLQEINRIAGTTEFNGRQLLTGELGPEGEGGFGIQVGINPGAENRIAIDNIQNVNTDALGISNLNLNNPGNAMAALNEIDNAIGRVAGIRARVGALENRFQTAASNLMVIGENFMAAGNQIMGLDFANEATSLGRNSFLLNVGIIALHNALRSRENLIGGLLNTFG